MVSRIDDSCLLCKPGEQQPCTTFSRSRVLLFFADFFTNRIGAYAVVETTLFSKFSEKYWRFTVGFESSSRSCRTQQRFAIFGLFFTLFGNLPRSAQRRYFFWWNSPTHLSLLTGGRTIRIHKVYDRFYYHERSFRVFF